MLKFQIKGVREQSRKAERQKNNYFILIKALIHTVVKSTDSEPVNQSLNLGPDTFILVQVI